MKIKGREVSNRTLALLAAAILMLGTGGISMSRAALETVGDDYDMSLQLEKQFTVQLIQNEEEVDELFGSVSVTEPGKKYEDVVSVRNAGTADQYVRVIVRKYWTGPKDSNSNNRKDLGLKPDMIQLETADGWKAADTDREETTIYYLTEPLGVGEEVDLFKSLRIDPKVADYYKIESVSEETGQNSKVTSYICTYDYNGYVCNVEAEAQSVQTHNSEEAIRSVWGIDPASVGIDLVD